MCKLSRGAAAEQKDRTSYSADEILSTRQSYSAYKAALRWPKQAPGQTPSFLVAQVSGPPGSLLTSGLLTSSSLKAPPPDGSRMYTSRRKPPFTPNHLQDLSVFSIQQPGLFLAYSYVFNIFDAVCITVF